MLDNIKLTLLKTVISQKKLLFWLSAAPFIKAISMLVLILHKPVEPHVLEAGCDVPL